MRKKIKNFERYKMLLNARRGENRLLWVIGTILIIAAIIYLTIEVGKEMDSKLFVLSMLFMAFSIPMIIFYYFYIQFLAKCYRCPKCKKLFVPGFWSVVFKDTFLSRKESVSDPFYRVGFVKDQCQEENHYLYKDFVIKCPYCKRNLFKSENIEKITEDKLGEFI